MTFTSESHAICGMQDKPVQNSLADLSIPQGCTHTRPTLYLPGHEQAPNSISGLIGR